MRREHGHSFIFCTVSFHPIHNPAALNHTCSREKGWYETSAVETKLLNVRHPGGMCMDSSSSRLNLFPRNVHVLELFKKCTSSWETLLPISLVKKLLKEC